MLSTHLLGVNMVPEINKVAVLGAGTIGASWAALFAAAGHEVTVYDPSDEAPGKVLGFVNQAAPALVALGWENASGDSRIRFTKQPEEAVESADFIQENAPEHAKIKHALYARIEPHLAEHAIIGSSTSGLTLSVLQKGFVNPERLVIAHPFNPPHLIPLVELVGNECTGPGVLDRAQSFFESLGKECVRLNKEIPGHIANRLQAAIWREAIHLIIEGVASLEDVDKAISAGPGIRWAAMGPNSLLHLGGGEGGIRGFCEHLGPAFESWWDDLGTPRLTPDVVDALAKGVEEMLADHSEADLRNTRDNLILQFLLVRNGEQSRY